MNVHVRFRNPIGRAHSAPRAHRQDKKKRGVFDREGGDLIEANSVSGGRREKDSVVAGGAYRGARARHRVGSGGIRGVTHLGGAEAGQSPVRSREEYFRAREEGVYGTAGLLLVDTHTHSTAGVMTSSGILLIHLPSHT